MAKQIVLHSLLRCILLVWSILFFSFSHEQEVASHVLSYLILVPLCHAVLSYRVTAFLRVAGWYY